jgi:hypothetical protein
MKRVSSPVIARSPSVKLRINCATRQSRMAEMGLDCFAKLAMTSGLRGFAASREPFDQLGRALTLEIISREAAKTRREAAE